MLHGTSKLTETSVAVYTFAAFVHICLLGFHHLFVSFTFEEFLQSILSVSAGIHGQRD